MVLNNFKNKGLGKGLAALLGENENSKNSNNENFKTEKVSIHLLKPNKYQPRKNFDKKQLQELSQSIKSRGIIQPILVREIEKNNFEIIAGERRWRAAQLAQQHQVPIVKLNVDDDLAAEFAVLENIQREGLNALEEANGFELLMNKFNYTQDKLSDVIGKSRVHISNTLRLKKLPQEIQDMITNGFLTPGHARTLIEVPNNIELARTIVNNNLSVRQAEFLSKKSSYLKSATKNKKRFIDSNITDIQNEIQNKTGMTVFISNKKNNSGKISLDYENIEQLNRLIKIIKENY